MVRICLYVYVGGWVQGVGFCQVIWEEVDCFEFDGWV